LDLNLNLNLNLNLIHSFSLLSFFRCGLTHTHTHTHTHSLSNSCIPSFYFFPKLNLNHSNSSNLKYALVGKYTNLMDDGHEKIEIMNPHTDLSGSEDGSTSITSTMIETSGKAKLDNSGFIHPDHDHIKRTYDIMLMKLSRPATNVSSDQLMKINLNPSIPIKEKEGANEITVIGMGNTDVRGLTPKPDTLQQVHLNYLPYEQCIDSEGYNLDYKFELLPHMICTQGTGIYGNRGQCYGDSGGKFCLVVLFLLYLYL
jgi:hypothetical protein